MFWREVDDVVASHLWTSPFVDEIANDAVMEVVRRGHTIIDSSTTAICTIAYAADAVSVPIDSRVIDIRHAIVRGRTAPLIETTIDDIEAGFPGWRSTTSTYPTVLIKDWESGKRRLWPIPTASGYIDMTVAREPTPLTADTHVPEIPARYHQLLRHWMKKRAFEIPDTETQDLQRSAAAEAEFTKEFGPRIGAVREKWRSEQSRASALPVPLA